MLIETPTQSAAATELCVDECIDRLTSSRVGRLAVVTDGHPDIFPVNHVYDRQLGRVVFPTGDGFAQRSGLSWPWVAFEVDSFDLESRTRWTVLVVGELAELEYEDDVVRLLTDWPGEWAIVDDARWMSIVPTDVTGKEILEPAAPSARGSGFGPGPRP